MKGIFKKGDYVTIKDYITSNVFHDKHNHIGKISKVINVSKIGHLSDLFYKLEVDDGENIWFEFELDQVDDNKYKKLKEQL